MFFDITHAQYEREYRIRLEFQDGSSGVVDLSEYPDENTVFNAFFDLNYFQDFSVEHGVLFWGNGEIDVAPETLYEMATNKPVRYPEVSSQRD